MARVWDDMSEEEKVSLTRDRIFLAKRLCGSTNQREALDWARHQDKVARRAGYTLGWHHVIAYFEE